MPIDSNFLVQIKSVVRLIKSQTFKPCVFQYMYHWGTKVFFSPNDTCIEKIKSKNSLVLGYPYCTFKHFV